MTHGAAHHSSRFRIRWGRISAVLVALIVILIAGYVAACALAPIPPPRVQLTTEAVQEIVAEDAAVQATVDAQGAPTAVGWSGDGAVWSNSDETVSIASITKLVTALVGLEARPLEPGSDGETHVWSIEDEAQQAEFIAMDGIVFPIPVGTEVTERQMLTLALIPSGNDFAVAYANSVFGSNEAFVAAVDDWKERHEFDSLTIVEPSGMDERNSANPADLVRIARLALENPTIVELTSTETAILPWGIGEVTNTNPLLGTLPGVVGLKTGTTLAAGSNLAAAQQASIESEAEAREVTKIAVTLGRPSAEARAADTRAVLVALDGTEQHVELVQDQEAVAKVTTIDGQSSEVAAAGKAAALLLPGEQASRTVELGSVSIGPSGREVGSIEVVTSTGEQTVPLVTATTLIEPDFWWRLTHPGLLFGADDAAQAMVMR